MLGRMFDAIEFRGYSQDAVERPRGLRRRACLQRAHRRVPPHADARRHHDHARVFSDKPLHEIKYAYIGDTRSNMGHSLMIVGCLVGMDVRICGPKSLWPSDSYVKIARDLEAKYGAKLTITDDPKDAVAGVDFIHTDVWVSMGEPKEIWAERIKLLTPYQVNADLMKATGNPHVKFMHCLPAFHDTETKLGKQIHGAIRHLRHRGNRRSVRIRDEHRVRAGRKPNAYDQSDAGRDAGRLKPCASSWLSAAMLCYDVASP